ncbi:phage tail assembly chaperone [Marinobacter sp.]|jgi:hypothetical protein|uniref:phage tail assembly chaperone n=1 Tax=Marinobacter sp. TaxID=50741 RepID=UPI000C8D43F9|nr:phage tail assembly chaperone [Marinobacter sp.]MAK51360.1 hypothetical protein [Marinobacter sp.]|tara:strand:- start:2148 stop:2435 length:288 start_codon:yes stop_codon:yes gene_type:complete
MVDIYKNVNGESIKLEGAELDAYNKMIEAKIADAPEKKKRKLRNQRKELLEEADWQINKKIDNNQDATSWRTYRQALRDITSGDVDNPTWPTKPS